MAPVNPRPRSYAEHPDGPLAPKPANDNVLGSWENGVFRFASSEAKEKWRRKSYEQGVGEETWHHGKAIDSKSATIVQAGLGGANPGLYQAPDGTFRLMNAKTIESQETRDHRNKYLTGKTIDQIAVANAMPGADEWVAKGKSAQAAVNDNAVNTVMVAQIQPLKSSPSATTKPLSAKPLARADQGAGQIMAGRFGPMKSITDARIAAEDDIEKPAGKWVGDVFVFNSFEDHQRAVRGFYRQGVGEDTWYLGRIVDPKSVNSTAANPGLYRAPDGTYRLMNDQTIESEAARAHRDHYLADKTIDQIASGESMPGEDEWVEKWTAAWKEGRPSLGHRYAAAVKKTIVDGSNAGNAAQQFASGYARDPDTLATRPSDKFLQLGSKGILDWHRMYEDLGIGGGKRRIDLLSPEERAQWETEWGQMSAQQQAATRAMWEEKQKSYRPWREQYERDVAVPPAETGAEKVADGTGVLTGIIFSPDNLFMLGRPFTELASAARTGTSAGTIKGLVRVGDNLVETSPIFGTSRGVNGLKDGAKDLLANGSKEIYDPFGRLPKINTRVLTNKETYHLTGDETGLAFVLETPTSNPEALAFENRLLGRVIDIESKKILSPSLLFRNPNGRHIARFDGIGLAPDRSTALLVDGKLRYPYFFNKGAMEDARKTLRRWTEALEQNPGYSIMVVFPNEEEMLAAQAAFKLEGVSDRIFARVIEDE